MAAVLVNMRQIPLKFTFVLNECLARSISPEGRHPMTVASGQSRVERRSPKRRLEGFFWLGQTWRHFSCLHATITFQSPSSLYFSFSNMSISNPSHLLISRNPPRSPAHPQLAPTSTSRHATNAPPPPPGVAGPWTQPDEAAAAAARQSTYLSTIENEVDPEDVDIHPTFRRDSLLPGRVRVVVGRHEFWCHKEVLWFASPFFQALLQGR